MKTKTVYVVQIKDSELLESWSDHALCIELGHARDLIHRYAIGKSTRIIKRTEEVIE